MAASEKLAFLYPWFLDPADERYFDPTMIAAALAFSEAYRPLCLDAAKGDEAVAHYTAYLLEDQRLRRAGETAPRQVKREQEGDVSREYVDEQGTGINAPVNSYQKWDALNRICRAGSILVSHAVPFNPVFPPIFR